MKQNITFLAFFLLTYLAGAQVGIGTTNPSPASNLEVSGTTNGVGPYRGFMPPRVATIAQRDLIPATSTDVGLMIFVLDPGCLQLWDGDSWENVNCFTVPPVPTEPWINELHYDNGGSDAGEGVEIAGPAGIDLSDYRIEFYNGSNGLSYDGLTLTGIIGDEGNGFAAEWFPRVDIQNGAPDGLALVKISTGTVLQFISYEGFFTAADGPAAGAVSQDIIVQEDTGTAIDESLQLTGTGNRYTDFNWNGPTPHSRGLLNVGQTVN
ncbi:hypothetical protein [Cochleicola gelatinilyticus]|uniref:LTD domain-containing protein n=1 Tax=Cochleicola gelatinilyticus TaxID=1763537 RepID=A0A167GVN5_9FLAO|nr:hypothetical protein [Cochleicola gelatinilyticus]OAB77952.1 hypothetical protein ULVI_10710 [Cochleicola gelatinilyticus]